jgi:phosphatidylethanolamine-binding protein (PEBP) family uncharacterized protein
VRNAKIARQKMMTPQLEAYFALKHRPTTVKRSKSYLNLVAALGEFPTKYDFDESKLSNEEYIKLGINQEAATSAKLWNIFPNFVKPFVPKINLQVRHADKTSIARGHFLESKKVQEKPSIKYEAKSDSFYTLMMVDPDIPLKSTEHDAWNHYTLVNVPGNDLTQGEVLADWVPPAPPKHTGVHRYIWLLLEQPGKITFTETKRTSSDFDRVIQFDQFIKRHQLKPRGIAFHRTQFDQDVAELYAGWGASATGFHVSDYQPKLIIKPRQYQGM